MCIYVHVYMYVLACWHVPVCRDISAGAYVST